MKAEAAIEGIENEQAYHLKEDGEEYLTFRLANEEYGVDILRVQEIRGWENVTRIPNAPNYVKGVLNLRGAIVPIMDLRIRFDLPTTDYTPTTVVVVLAVMSRSGEKKRIVGVVVDAISDVVNAKMSDIQATPNFDASIEIEYIQGLATASDKMLMLVDVDKLLNIEDDVLQFEHDDIE
ncbi:MAG: chemotaxis protein CheW [Gammaproteobacteria bacterium]|nr:chemotaxis protein CheW [Gammaproteobacteria bacterium]